MNKPTECNIHKYKMYCNKLNSLLRLAKQNDFSGLLEREKYNINTTWKILNSILRSSKKSVSDKFVVNGNAIKNPKSIANEFNKYFANIDPSLADSIKHSGKHFTSYLKNSHYGSTWRWHC